MPSELFCRWAYRAPAFSGVLAARAAKEHEDHTGGHRQPSAVRSDVVQIDADDPRFAVLMAQTGQGERVEV